MQSQSSSFLTISMEVAASQSDPLDSPGPSKRLMIELADRLVDDAIDKMPGYLSAIPSEFRPTSQELSRVFRRGYRLRGPKLDLDLSVRPTELPAAWVDSLLNAAPLGEDIPWPIVWTTRILGLWFGLGKQDRQKVMREAHEKTVLQQRRKVQNELCHGMMRLTSAAVETELMNSKASLLMSGPLQSITLHRSV